MERPVGFEPTTNQLTLAALLSEVLETPALTNLSYGRKLGIRILSHPLGRRETFFPGARRTCDFIPSVVSAKNWYAG